MMPIDHVEPARKGAQRMGVLGRSAVFVNVAFRSAKGGTETLRASTSGILNRESVA